MAKGKHISEDEIKYIVDVESAKAQQEIRKLEKSTDSLRSKNQQRLREMIKLEAQGKKESQHYKNLRKEYNELNKKIKDNIDQIGKLTKEIKVSDLTMNQLRKEAKQLQKQLDDTSKSLNPEVYKELEGRLEIVNSRMSELKGKARDLKEVYHDLQTQSFLLGTALTEIVKTGINFLWKDLIGGIHSFISEGIEMAQSADGITKAFEGLNQPGLLDNLRAATKGTVNDVELMKAAVKARDFRIPLEDLGKYLSFAQLKAQQTGESLDNMVDSIVTGLGRQSPQILDNLGLSAAEIKEQTKQTGDFMKGVAGIVEKQLANAGETYISAAERAAKRTTDLQNAQRELGQALLPVSESFTNAYGEIQISLLKVIKFLVENRKWVLLVTTALTTLAITTAATSVSIKNYIVSSKLAAAATAMWNTAINGVKGTAALCSLGIAKLTGNTQKATKAMQAFNAAGKASVIGVLITLVLSLAAAIYLLSQRYSTAAKTQRLLNDIKTEAIRKAADERTQIELLAAAARDETLTLTDRQKAINALNKIIPNYNGQLDKTTGKYRENKKALDDYLVSLAKKYELEGAKDMLRELGKEAAEAQVNLDKAKKALDDAKNAGKGYTYTTSWGMVGNTTQDLTAKRQQEVNAANAVLSDIQTRQDAIFNSFGKALKLDALNSPTANEDNSKDVSKGSGKGIGSGSGSGPDPDTEMVKKFDEARDQSLKKWQQFYEQRQHQLKESLIQQRLTQEEYDTQMRDLEMLNASNILTIEKGYYEKTSDLALKDATKKKDLQQRYQGYVETAQRNSDNAKLNLKQLYYQALDKIDQAGKLQQTLTLEQEKEAELTILEGYYKTALERAKLYEEDEKAVIESYEKAKGNIIKKYSEKAAQQQLQARQKYGLLSEQERMYQELKEIKDDYDKKLLTKEQYEQAVADKEKEYAEKRRQQRAGLGVERQNEYQQQLEQLRNALDQQLITQEEYEQRVAQLKRDSWKQQFDYYQQLFGNAIKALQDAELANVEAKYDAEIEAARQAGKDTTDLENKKANEKLRIEKKYADVNFAVKASQIIADTAVSIMKALAELGPIAGPIAAALMGVTGAAQLAAANAERQKVKKMTLNGSSASTSAQRTRVATGFEDGGSIDIERRQDGRKFHAKYDPDRRGYIDRPTVIVGEGARGKSLEWVASNAALQNPTVAPLIDIIDRAQRVGNISTLDMRKYLLQQQAMGLQQGGYISRDAKRSSIRQDSQSPARTGSQEELPDTILRLCTILDRIDTKGIHSFVAIDEIDAQQKLLNKSRQIGKKS